MFNHEPPEAYICPFCKLLQGDHSAYNNPDDIVLRTPAAFATIAPKSWPNNRGHVLVIPTGHYENIYDIPDEVLRDVYSMVKRVSLAIRSTYDCDGTSTRQHNEPAGGQDVWHLHVHVFPRYANDQLYLNDKDSVFLPEAERLPYAERLRSFLAAPDRQA